MLREKFQAFKRSKHEVQEEEESEGEVESTLTPETTSYEVRSQIDMWNTTKFNSNHAPTKIPQIHDVKHQNLRPRLQSRKASSKREQR